jgi:hypothetical protein
MKQIAIFGLLLVSASLAFAQNTSGTFTGEIMDKQCAQMGSHENMMKAQGAKDAKECTLACVKSGDKFALLDPATKKVYLIDNDKKVRQYAGQKVQITGTYDDDAGVLQVKSIAPAP